jgi:SAM-dependent methyltransferase
MARQAPVPHVMDPAYARGYRDLYERHWWWRAREEVVLATMERIAPPGGWSAILDIGCGDALLFDELNRFAPFVEGVESDPGLVSDTSRWRERIHVRPFDETFDTGQRYGLVLMLDVLEHMDRPDAALRHAVSLLQPGGRIVINVPAFRSLWTSHDDYNRHVTRFTRRTFAALAAAAPMRIESWRYLFHWTWPVKFAQRLAERAMPGTPRPATVPPAWLNRSLLALCRAEQRLLGRVPVPFGSSLFVVGTAAREWSG